jgi:hypothetical protein
MGTAQTQMSSMHGGRQMSRPLNRKFAIALALIGLWILSCLGVFVLIHFNGIYFFGLHGHDKTTIEQIAFFYLAWTGSQIPAAASAAMIICSSDFLHPLRATFWTAFAYFVVMSLIRAVHWPWMQFQDLDQSIPILSYLTSILLLIGFSVSVAWFMPRFHRICLKFSTR